VKHTEKKRAKRKEMAEKTDKYLTPEIISCDISGKIVKK